MEKIRLQEVVKTIINLYNEGNFKCSLLGIGPMSKNVIKASLISAKEKDYPVMFIASRNQVDLKEFGGGYVCGWDQKAFVTAIAEAAEEAQFDGLYYICRDHGGPWQRDEERSSKIKENIAMDISKKSYREDLIAGFDLLHIDPTKDPQYGKMVPFDLVIKRTVELISYIEEERKDLGLPEVAYEIGTEETNGGLTSHEAFEDFINRIEEILYQKRSANPSFIVGQTGTLTRLTENIGNFNAVNARLLGQICIRHKIGLKEHNGDYLNDIVLYMHPILGILAVNVAPEFGVVETRAHLMLAMLESEAFNGGILQKQSNFIEVFSLASVSCQKWRKWMINHSDINDEEVWKDKDLVKLITEVSGHYVHENEDVKNEKEKLFANIRFLGLNPEDIIIQKIKASIDRYAGDLNLKGATTTIKMNCAMN